MIGMTEQQQPQLNWEASAHATHPQVSTSLPSEVETCLKNARFVHSPLHVIAMLFLILTVLVASSCDLRRPLPSHLSNELYLPSQHAFPPRPHHHNDNESLVEENHEFAF